MKRFWAFLCLLSAVDVGGSVACRENVEWKCDNGQCIAEAQLCDGRPDCADASDEIADHCMHFDCSKVWFRCAYGACIDGDSECDHERDCADGSDELPIVCNKEETLQQLHGKCGSARIQCTSGECISDDLLCDGQPDCPDGSDETLEVCAGTECEPPYFQCGYGACIDGEAKCNNTIECIDGSDEAFAMCGRVRPPRTTVAPAVLGHFWFPLPRTGCRIPIDLWHTIYVNVNFNSTVQPGSAVSVNTLVEVRCEAGFMMEKENGNRNTCTANGWRHQFPRCFKPCSDKHLLADFSTIVHCIREGSEHPCQHPILPGTVASVTCAPGFQTYESFWNLKSREEDWQIRCTENGNWDKAKTLCRQVCGKLQPKLEYYSNDGTETSVENIPWHVGIYTNDSSLRLDDLIPLCGGSILAPDLVITAAHCFWNKADKVFNNKENYVIVAGKTCLKYKCSRDGSFLQTSFIAELITDDFNENNNNDVALLRLAKPFTFTRYVKPICYENLLGGESHVETTTRDKYFYSAWNSLRPQIEQNETKNAFQTLKVQTMSYMHCKEHLNQTLNAYELAHDKFCVSPLTTGQICHGDSGSGIVDRVSQTYGLRGIISHAPRTTAECIENGIMVATNVHEMSLSLRNYIIEHREPMKVELN